MLSNKMLILTNCFFNLPDNFEGDETDALELMVQYRIEKKNQNKINTTEENFHKSVESLTNEDYDLNDRYTENYYELIGNENIKCVCENGIYKLNKETNKFEF